jgi:hypothetical protein
MPDKGRTGESDQSGKKMSSDDTIVCTVKREILAYKLRTEASEKAFSSQNGWSKTRQYFSGAFQ